MCLLHFIRTKNIRPTLGSTRRHADRMRVRRKPPEWCVHMRRLTENPRKTTASICLDQFSSLDFQFTRNPHNADPYSDLGVRQTIPNPRRPSPPVPSLFGYYPQAPWSVVSCETLHEDMPNCNSPPISRIVLQQVSPDKRRQLASQSFSVPRLSSRTLPENPYTPPQEEPVPRDLWNLCESK